MKCSCNERMKCTFSVPVGKRSRYRYYICECGSEKQEMLDVPVEALLTGKMTTEKTKDLLVEGQKKRSVGKRIGFVKKGGQLQ